MPDLVIELDRHEEPDEQISSRRWRPWRSRQLWIATALAVACVLALGSGGKPLPGVRLVADITMPHGGQVVALGGEILIDEPGTLTALDSRTARPRWRVQTGMERHLVTNEGDLVLVTGAASLANGAATQLWSLAIDMGTGEVRWRLPGFVTIVGGLVVSHVTDNGDPIGSVVLPELVGVNGLHYVTGGVVAFFSDGGVASRRGSELVFVDGFPAEEEERTDCGSVWCVNSPGAYAITLVDKASGEPVNLGARWEFVIAIEGGVVGIDPDFGQAVQSVSLFEALTRRRQQLPGWSMLGPRLDARVKVWRV